ncbi:hypothetical protein ACU4GG_40850 [Streptomyces nojiriensis]
MEQRINVVTLGVSEFARTAGHRRSPRVPSVAGSPYERTCS